jgi:eukaryotic-like serine/threonine-protein kinase
MSGPRDPDVTETYHPSLPSEYVNNEDLAVLPRRICRLPAEKGVVLARPLGLGLVAMGERTMGAADSFGGKALTDEPTDAVAEGDASSRTVGPAVPGSETADTTGESKGRDHPTVTAVTTGEATLNPSDSLGFLLRVDPPTKAGSSSERGDYGGTEAERNVTAPPAGDPLTDLTTVRPEPAAPRGRPVPTIVGYEILGELGRGGMGVVYLARQVRLNRLCALKMILGGAHADAPAALRFLAEAEAVAKVQHPNIVQIHHIGEADGLPFIELEYVDGGGLDRSLDGTPWHERRAAALIEALARGVAEAHRLDIVHRDLKPGNVLLAANGTPKITDFGLAKSLATDSGLTATDSIMGSPGYMAPEQAEGKTKQAGPLADVYSLGAILYELLTGRPPFRGATVLETLEQVKATEPVPPSRLVPGLPRDVETIALKCLQKEPAKRYDSAAALAEDLRRFLGGEPIVARPVPPWERAIKWARRRPAITTLILAVLLLLASLLGLGIWSYAKIDRSLAVARADRRHAEEQTRFAQEQTRFAQEQTRVANQRAEDLAWEDYINRVNRAYREVQDDNVALAEDLLHGCPAERRGWEWHYVKRLCHPERMSVEVPGGSVSAIAYSPDGRGIATGSGGHFARGPGGSNLALWDRETGRRRQTPHPTENIIWSLAFSPDGTRMALGGTNPQVEVRDARTDEVLWTKQDPELPPAMSVTFSPDGTSLAAGFGYYSADGTFQVKLFEVATGQAAATFPGPRGGVNDLAFHPDGRHVAVAGSGGIEVWDVKRQAKVHDFRGHTKWVYGVAYSPDGRWLATGGWDRTIKLRDAASGEERLTIFGHEGFVLDLAFSPDSRCLVSASEDRSVRLWEVPTGRRLGTFHGHTDFVQAVAFAPDGGEVASVSLDGTMKVWDRRTSLPVTFDGHTGWVAGLAFRRDGRRVVSKADGYQVPGETTKGWDPVTGDLDPALTGIVLENPGDEYLPPSAYAVTPRPATSPDGTRLARVRSSNEGIPAPERSKTYVNSAVVVLDAATRRVLHTMVGHTADVVGIAFSPDGRRIATASFDRTIKLWDAATGREVFTLRGHTAGLLALTFSPDGRRIVSGGIDFTARVWDATPLRAEVIRAQDVRYQQKHEALGELARLTQEAQRAEELARSGRWDLAAAMFGKFVEQDPGNRLLRYMHIQSLAAAGDNSGVRRACEDLLAKFGKGTDSWIYVLAPDSVADPEVPVHLTRTTLSQLTPQSEKIAKCRGLKKLGAALYRAGRYEEAIRHLDESLEALDGADPPRVFAFLAMAHHRLGHRDEAKRWLGKLAAYRPKDGPEFSWDDVEIRILRREAEALILGSRPAAPLTPPSAPNEEVTGHPVAKPE